MLNNGDVARELGITLWQSVDANSQSASKSREIHVFVSEMTHSEKEKTLPLFENIKRFIQFLNHAYCIDEISDLVLGSKLDEVCKSGGSKFVIGFGFDQSFKDERFASFPSLTEIMQNPMIKKQVFLDVSNSV